MNLLVIAMNYESPDLDSADQGFAFSAIITEDGAEVLSADRHLLARFASGGNEQNGSLKTEATRVEPSQDPLLDPEIDRMPNGVELQVTDEEYPSVYRLVMGGFAAAAKDPAGQHSSKDTESESPSLRVVWTPGGVLSIVERADGVMYMVVFAADIEHPESNSADRGFALSANITDDGAEILSVDRDLLARFAGAGQAQSGSLGAGGTEPHGSHPLGSAVQHRYSAPSFDPAIDDDPSELFFAPGWSQMQNIKRVCHRVAIRYCLPAFSGPGGMACYNGKFRECAY